jgi:hypothetical protein
VDESSSFFSQSELMGPTKDQEKAFPCAVDGNCSYPFGEQSIPDCRCSDLLLLCVFSGADTIGLIYVNPGGFLGDYINLESSAKVINQTFGLMSMNAEETVALIGG